MKHRGRPEEARLKLVECAGSVTATICVFLVQVACAESDRLETGSAVVHAERTPDLVNHAPVLSAGWEVGIDGRTVLGDDDTEEGKPLFRVTRAAKLGEHRFAIWNAGYQELWIVDEKGIRTKLGGRGEGPGRFLRATALLRMPADSLVIYDSRTHRLTYFGPDGTVTSSRRLSWRTQGAGMAYLRPLKDGKHVVLRGISPLYLADEDGRRRGLGWIEIIDEVGGSTQRILEMPLREAVVADGAVFYPTFFHRHFVVVGSDRIFVGYSDRYEFGIYDLHGRLLRQVKRDHEARSVDEKRHREYMNRFGREQWDAIGHSRREGVGSSHYPAFRSALVDSQDNLWVQEFVAGTDNPRRWSVFEKTGRWLTDVRMPVDVRVLEIGEDYVLGVVTDEIGRESVVEFELNRPR